MTDEQAADLYRMSLEELDPLSIVGPAFLAGAAFKEEQERERIISLESRLACAEDLLTFASISMLIIEEDSCDFEHDDIAGEWLRCAKRREKAE